MTKMEKRAALHIDAGKPKEIEETLAAEADISVLVNGERVLTISCTPSDLRQLVYGMLLSEGIVSSVGEIASLKTRGNDLLVETSEAVRCSGNEPLMRIESEFNLPAETLLQAAKDCSQRSMIFRRTGGTHAAGIGDTTGLLNFFEDVSRSCALQKAVGDALLQGFALNNTFIFVSSRLSKSMLLRIAHCGIPIVAAISAPTLQAVDEAKKLGICVCCFVRGERFNVYSHRWRVRL